MINRWVYSCQENYDEYKSVLDAEKAKAPDFYTALVRARKRIWKKLGVSVQLTLF